MVDRFQITAEETDARPADQGHQGLEETEEERHAERPQVASQHTADDGHREAVHRQRYSQQYDVKETHQMSEKATSIM